MITVAAFSEMLSMIYAAAVAPEVWDEAIACIHHAFVTATVAGGRVLSTSLVFTNGDNRSMVGVLSPEAQPGSYSQHYGRHDYVLQAVERGPVGLLRSGTEVIAPRTCAEFFADWIRPNGLSDGMFVRLTNHTEPTSFLVAGTQGSEPFDNEERRQLFTMLVPHLQHALRVQSGLTSLSCRTSELTGALDSIEHGILLIAPDLRVLHGNVAAKRILGEGDGFGLQTGRLAASLPRIRLRLEAMLRFALDGDAGGIRHGGYLACERPSGRRPYAVHILPMNTLKTDPASRGPIARVLIIDPERRSTPAPDLLRQLFNLTKTETAVAQLTMNGEGLGPIGDRLQLSRDTVKTHLSSVFNKTGTHRQAELVRLLLAVTV